jgi:hypothetical protein
LLRLASSPLRRRRLGTSGVSAARKRSWERSLEQLAAGYGQAAGTTAADRRQAPVRAA